MIGDIPLKTPQKTADVLVVLHLIPRKIVIDAANASDGVHPLRTRTVPALNEGDEPIATHHRRHVQSNDETDVVEDNDLHRTNSLELHVRVVVSW